MMKSPAPMNIWKRAAEATVRCLKMEIGNVALSPRFIWTIIKMMIKRPNPIKRPMMTELFQACSVPPHCKANRRHTMPLQSAIFGKESIRDKKERSQKVDFTEFLTERKFGQTLMGNRKKE
jgi:hypothetical protein